VQRGSDVLLVGGRHVGPARRPDQLEHVRAVLREARHALRLQLVAWAREICGGNGISVDYGVGRFFADAEAFYTYEGTYQMQNLIIGKAITGVSAFV